MTSFFRKICLETAVRFINGPYGCQYRSDNEDVVLKDGRVYSKLIFYFKNVAE